jgi:hypothetical protein
MAKKRQLQIGGEIAASPVSDERLWAGDTGGYLAGRAYLDAADLLAATMERKWGADRLRLLVGPELREKFDRQRYLLNQAIWHGDLEAVRRESQRMVNAWQALDAAATTAGAELLAPQVWEVAVGEGADAYVAAIVPDNTHAHAVTAQGRKVVVFTLDEIAKLLAAMPAITKTKTLFPGAAVTAVRQSIEDPLLAIHDTDMPLDDEIPF